MYVCMFVCMCLILIFLRLDSIMVPGNCDEASERSGGSLPMEPFGAGAAHEESEERWRS